MDCIFFFSGHRTLRFPISQEANFAFLILHFGWGEKFDTVCPFYRTLTLKGSPKFASGVDVKPKMLN